MTAAPRAHPFRWLALTLGVLVAAIGLFNDFFGLRDRFFGPPSTEQSSTLARISREGTLKVGYIPYFDVTSCDATSGEPKGFLVDVLYEVADSLGVPPDSIKFLPTDWGAFGTGLNQGKFDLSIAGTFRTPQREQIVDFTDPIFHLGNGALVRVDDRRFINVDSIDDFDQPGLVVATVLGEFGYEYATKHFQHAQLQVLQGADLTLAPLSVKQERADVALSDQFILRRYARANPDVRDALADAPYSVLPICWAVKKGEDELRAHINTQLDALASTGWIRNLRLDYPGIPFAKPTASTQALVGPAQQVSFLARGWHFLTRYSGALASGIFYTLYVSLTAIFLGTLLGIALGAVLAKEPSTRFRRLVKGTVYVFLGIPALVLILVVYYAGFLPSMSAATAAIIALAINLSPFAATIITTGLQNLPETQILAAKAFGYTEIQIAWQFKRPLILRLIGKPLLVQYFTTIKLSSLASIIGVAELLNRSQQALRETYDTFWAYFWMVACYLVIVIPIAWFADQFEKRMGRPTGRGA